jgi:hypothetical protein
MLVHNVVILVFPALRHLQCRSRIGGFDIRQMKHLTVKNTNFYYRQVSSAAETFSKSIRTDFYIQRQSNGLKRLAKI